MKRFQAASAEIVRRIVDNINDDEDFGDDVKDVQELGQEDYWTQIDGDANPWVWGGSWFNPAKNQIIHFEGIDQDGVREIDPKDVEIPATMLAKLPPEKEDWRENSERDKIIQNYQYSRAEFLNNRLEHKFWRIWVARPSDPIYAGYENEVKSQFDPETAARYDTWPLPNKLLEIGRYTGMSHIGDQFDMNYIEARNMGLKV